MRYSRFFLCVLILLSLLGLAIASPKPTRASGMPTFIHVTTAANTSGYETIIDNTLINGDPNAILIVTQNWNPGGVGGTYNNHSVAVKYNGSQWVIYNYDFAPMPIGAAFNVGDVIAVPENFQTATAWSSGPNYILFDHPLLNSDPSALAIITLHNFGPPSTHELFTSPIGIWYSDSGYWSGYTETRQVIPSGMGFNICVFATTVGRLHTSTSANTVGNFTYIDSPTANKNPDAIVFVTHNWNPGGVGSTYLPKELGVWYDSGVGQWAIFTQDGSAMPLGLTFNVLG